MISPKSKIGLRRLRRDGGWFLRKVSDVKAIGGNRAPSPAAEDAVRNWRAVPADAESTVTVEAAFALAR